MWNIVKKDEGGALVLAAIAMVVLLGFAALAIDVGAMLTARNQLQGAVDAAALAGASGLIVSQGEATNRAIALAGVNTCINQNVAITAANVTFPTASRVRVQANRLLDLFFARVLGRNTANITAVAVAENGALSGSGNIKPWAIPDSNYVLGELIILKAGDPNGGASGTGPSVFYPVDFPPVNKGTPITGATAYEDAIVNGSSMSIDVGDILKVEPGNMVGPTGQGVDYLISQDPGASWNPSMNQVVSTYPGYSSPRIIKIPFYDPCCPPEPGRDTVTITRLGAFFLEGMQGRNVYGRFIEEITSGTFGPGPSGLYGVKLVE